MNKRGQFFLVAALLISLIIIGFSATSNFITNSNTEQSTYSLPKEIKYEVTNIIEKSNPSSASFDQDTLNTNIVNFVSYYAQSNPDKKIIIIYGTREGSSPSYTYKLYRQDYVNGQKDSSSQIPQTDIDANGVLSISDNNIIYSFDIKNSENIFVIVYKEKDGEKLTATA